MEIINLFAGPGAGKSTTAAGLFFKMKLMNFRCELVTEYAKELTYENRLTTLDNQIYVFGKQLQRIERLKNQVDFVITDSPLLLSSIYAPKSYPESFHELVLDVWSQFENHAFFLDRTKIYQSYGRTQTEEEAKKIDEICKKYLDENEIPYSIIFGSPEAPDHIMEILGMKNG